MNPHKVLQRLPSPWRALIEHLLYAGPLPDSKHVAVARDTRDGAAVTFPGARRY